MSGPKVVRIITREEIIAVCRGQLARLDAALEAWTRDCTRSDAVTDDQILAAGRRRDQIRDLLAGQRFAELQKSVMQEIAFLDADRQERLERAAQAATRARTSARREREAAGSLLAALKRTGVSVTQDVEEALQNAAKGRGSAASALSAGFALLSAPAEINRDQTRKLAESLKVGEQDRSLERWLTTQRPSKDDLPLARIEARLGELCTLAGPEVAAPYEVRLTALQGGADGGRRSLLLDSLALDLGRELARGRAVADLRRRIALALAELTTVNAESALFEDVPPTSANEDLQERLDRLEAAITFERERKAAVARRRVVLEGLAALGYEVGADLTTAWVKDGRIVLRKPAHPGYGVEVSGGADAERFQMRVVAFLEADTDAVRDRDAETRWCGDVTQLQERLATAGAKLIIDRSLPVGAAPVKRVGGAIRDDRAASAERKETMARKLR